MKRFVQLLILLFTFSLAAWSQPTEFTPAQKLAYAIMADKIGEVKSLLSQNSSLLNVIDEKTHSTPLILAMNRKVNDPMLDAIFSVNFDVNQKTKLGTPLQCALNVGFANGAKRLIKAGADVNLTSTNSTPLHGAIASAYRDAKQAPALVNILVKAGANVNQRDKAGDPPLYTAAGLSFQNDAMAATLVKILLEAGAKPDPKITIEGKKLTLKAIMQGAKAPKTKAALGS